MAGDDLVTQGASSSATMIHVSTNLKWDNSVLTFKGLNSIISLSRNNKTYKSNLMFLFLKMDAGCYYVGIFKTYIYTMAI